ncbi:uncharacterized protein LOC134297981 [Anolis carolinensis]|uniref:uncharacterized protein LOC134297981 n=1 Tax=Anolis carolinensis TaxID=28377 RepID=UPI002F2B46AA
MFNWGGAVVLLNRIDYVKEVERHLSNTLFYKCIPQDPINKIKSLIRIVCTEGLSLGYISLQTYEFLQNQFPRTPVFYVLPKIHKGTIPPPGRPIVSGTASILEPIAQFIDHFLQPFVPLNTSFIKDTKHFINIVEALTIPERAILMTLDIEALYTNIPLDEARSVVKDILDTCKSLVPPTHFLMDLLDIVLEYNYFSFDKQFYLQTFGIAMGSPLAPSIANLFVSHLESKFIFNTTNNPFFSDIFYFGRFLDDIFIVMSSHAVADQFYRWINTLHKHMTFTKHYSHTHINFLEVMVFKNGQKLLVKNYSKPTVRILSYIFPVFIIIFLNPIYHSHSF